MRRVRLFRLGRVAYEEATRWQSDASRELNETGAEALALLEHLPVYTVGYRARDDEFLVAPDLLRRRGAAVVSTDRGGGITFHGPGQLVAYPILDLEARGLPPAGYVRRLEAVVIDALSALGIGATRVEGAPGVWAGGAKIASLGVRIRRGVSRHGVALNVGNDLTWFDAIVPCGLKGVRMTSVSEVAGDLPPALVEAAFCSAFEGHFDSELLPKLALAGAAAW